MELDVIIVLIFLVAASVFDLKERAIPVWLFIIGITGAVVSNICLGSVIITEKIGGMLIGFVLLAISKLTDGQIGEGDGISFLITGIVLGFKDNFWLLTEALFLSFIWSLVFLLVKKINLKTRLPFLPFVLMAFGFEIGFAG